MLFSAHFISTVTLNVNLSSMTQKSDVIIFVPKCLSIVRLVKISIVVFKAIVLTLFGTHGRTDGRTDTRTVKKHNASGHTSWGGDKAA